MAEEEAQNQEQPKEEENPLEEQVISLNRTNKVIKGGRSFHMGALVAVGDRNGRVGIGHGKANEVPQAINKGGQVARKNLISVPLMDQRTPTHAVTGRFRGAEVLMKPASEGTGIIAGSAVRIILELSGVQDVLTKSLGSSNPLNVAKATMEALNSLHSPEEVENKRDITGLSVEQ